MVYFPRMIFASQNSMIIRAQECCKCRLLENTSGSLFYSADLGCLAYIPRSSMGAPFLKMRFADVTPFPGPW